MPDTLDTGGPQITDQKLDALSRSVDERFSAVDAALVEQRQYTEFAFDKLLTEMNARFEKVDARFEKVDARFEKIDARFDKIEGRFDKVEGRFDRLERKLDQFIDTQVRTNALVERRLQSLEPKHGQK